MNRKSITAAFATSAVLATAALFAPAAMGHVTLQPTEAPAGAFTRFDVRVPNERDDAQTTRVAVKMPPGIFFASYEPKPGWDVEIERRELDQPVEAFGEEQSEEVDTVTFTADGRSNAIAAGQFLDFGLSVNVPEGDAGAKLEFPATQRYSSGETVRWIGPEDADEPAATVTLTAADEAGGHGAPGSSGAAAGTSSTDDDGGTAAASTADDGSNGLAIAALVVGGLGLVAGLAALLTARRGRAGTRPGRTEVAA